jgi:hypothetical protein
MSKKKKKKTKRTDNSKKTKPLVTFWMGNVVGLLISIMVVFLLFHNIRGYNWLWNNLVKQNIELIKKYPDLPIEKKWEIKCGFDYTYLNFIKENTPEDAIILMPPDSAIYPVGEKSDFKNASYSIKNKAWATYFLYPRKLVYEYEKGKNPLYEQANYVAIVNYWGYGKLNYKVSKQYKHTVLPIYKKQEK